MTDDRPQGGREPPLPSPALLALALREERHFCELFAGHAVELTEAHLVVNEKVPVPRFNYVQDARCGPGRTAAFLERTLEHYYQRALRPAFELPLRPSQPPLVEALRLMGYLSRGEDHHRHLLVWSGARPVPSGAARSDPDGELQVDRVPEDELGTFVDLLVESQARYREEVRRYLEVAIAHPHPGERVVPYVARAREGPVSFGLFHAHGAASGLFAVGTATTAREKGYATALVREVLAKEGRGAPLPLCLSAEGRVPPRPLLELGFEVWASFERFELSEEARKKGF